MDKFLREYHGHRFEDEGAYCSKDFKSFATKFKNYLKRTLPADCEVVRHNCGHYYLSGFIRRGNAYIYYSYSWDRINPVDIRRDDCFGGVLVRHAASDADYRGEHNNFTSIEELPRKLGDMFSRRFAAA